MEIPPPGAPLQELEPGLRRLIAPNPSPMTYWGTNTYILGTRDLAVIDPGPNHPGHLEAILQAVEPGQRITHVIVTHSHLDHSPLARPLAARCGAPVLAFGTAEAGRSQIMSRLVASGMTGGGEGIDTEFTPDQTLADGAVIAADGWSLEVIHTPGHLGNHISLAWGDACFTADHVMGWATSLVSPPDGDLTDFMASCERLNNRRWRIFHPGHGAPITEPNERLEWLITHRKRREAQILAALADGPASADDLARAIYTDTPPALLPMAARNVFAHLVDLYVRGQTAPETTFAPDAIFALSTGAS